MTVRALTQARLKELLHYDTDTGIFTRLVNRGGGRGAAGMRAGALKKLGSYRVLCVDYHSYYEHRLAWFYMTGEWPTEIDHRDLNKSNNAWTNLRIATRSTNNANTGLRKDNSSGFKGVSFNTKDRRWHAKIEVNRKTMFIGGFINKEEAAEAYRLKSVEVFGEFARSG